MVSGTFYMVGGVCQTQCSPAAALSALEAYNPGPTLVAAQQELGAQIEGKYSRAVLTGVRKRS